MSTSRTDLSDDKISATGSHEDSRHGPRLAVLVLCVGIAGCSGDSDLCWTDAHAIFESIASPIVLGGAAAGSAESELKSRRAQLRHVYETCTLRKPVYEFDLANGDRRFITLADIAVAADDTSMLASALQTDVTTVSSAEGQSYRGLNSLLHLAAAFEAPRAAELLISVRGGQNARGDGGVTPLHIASCWTENGREVVLGLLRSGAVVDAVDDAGMTPLGYAVRTSDAAKVALLSDAGARLDAPIDETGKKVRDLICDSASIDLRRAVQEFGSSIACN